MFISLFIISTVSAEDNFNDVNIISADKDINNLEVSNEEVLAVSADEAQDNMLAVNSKTFTDLNLAINGNDNTIINLTENYTYSDGDDEFVGGVTIARSVIIYGNGITIDGSKTARIFNVTAGNVVFHDITFINAKVNGYGAAIYWNGANGSVFSCIFANNFAWSDGGAIYGCSGCIDSCTFVNNTAHYGGAISKPNAVKNCTFINNVASCDGGAIFACSGCIDSCSFMNCSADGGGAISNSFIVITNCNFSVCSASGGGAIAFCTGVVNCSFIKNKAYASGGDAISSGTNISIINCTFIDNSVRIFPPYEPSDPYNITIMNSIFNNSYFYGAYDARDNSVVVKLSVCADGEEDVPLSADLELIIGDRIFKNSLKKGTVRFNLNSLPLGTYDAKIIFHNCSYTYMGKSYELNSLESRFPVIIQSIQIMAPNVTKDYGGSENLEITLTWGDSPIANANVNIKVNGSKYTKTTDSEGKAYMPIELDAGNYDAVLSYGDVSATAHITVNPLSSKITLSSSKNTYDSVTLSASVEPVTAGGDVVFNVNGMNYTAKIIDSKATYTLNNLSAGSYNVNATYNGDINHNSSTFNGISFDIEDIKYDVSAPDVTKYYNGPERFVVTLKDLNNNPIANAKIKININGVNYNRTTGANGQTTVALGIPVGNYTAFVEYEDIKVESSVIIKPTVSGNDITKIFRNGTQYYAKFIDTKGSVLKNTPVEFNINGIFYKRTTNDQGVAKMNINLNPGEYIITATNPNSTEMHSNIVAVLPNIVDNHDLTKFYRNDSQYVIKVLDDKGNPAAAGGTVTFNINGVLYNRTINATGHVKMNINLAPGKYIITAEYNNYKTSNVINVLPVLEAKDLNMKYRDGSKFEVKLVDGQGKAFASQKITFNINGVFYTRTTGADGIVRLNINLMAGEYIITSMYENGAAISNKVTIRS